MILTPIKIGNQIIKNRFVVPAMATNYCDHNGYATERFIRYLERKSQGGWGLIITENYAVNPEGRGLWVPGLWEDGQIEGHKKMTNAVHATGCKVIAQIYHAGRQTSRNITGADLLAPSAIPCPVMQELPKELTYDQIEGIKRDFVMTAKRAQKAGFDGIELHCGHGYLLAEFLSTYANKRTDKYGGNLTNRMRLPLEIYRMIRNECGSDFLITCRISGDEFVPGGRTIEETKQIASAFAKEGFDAMHITAGVYESTEYIMQPMYVPSGFLVDFAAEVKSVVDIPVITVGRINDPDMAEKIIQSGKADMVSMGRASLADPDLPNKYMDGDLADIRQCIACQQGCKDNAGKGEPICCLVNPKLGFEYEESDTHTESKKIDVVGGGVAGMEAAIAAKDAGHDVTLYEATDRLGGQFEIAAYPPAKGILATLIAWERHQLEKRGININMNTEYTADICMKKQPDGVIIATGGTPKVPRIEGIDLPHVVTATDVLRGKSEVGGRVVVAGGGMIGTETADYLATYGKSVTIVEMLPEVAMEEEPSRKVFLMESLTKRGVNILVDTKIKSISERGVVLENKTNEKTVEADSVVIALGMNSVNELADELQGKTKIEVIGDAKTVRNALYAVREGYLAGRNI